MDKRLLLGLVTAAVTGCGGDVEPEIIPGGGIGGGEIDGVANIYVIDDMTREPIAGATVVVGNVEGVTDTTGLFVAEEVDGPQTVIVKAANYRSAMWIGADGANMTINLELAKDPTPPSATLSGQINGFSAITVAANHVKTAAVWYSQTDDLGDPRNEIVTPNDMHTCLSLGNINCTFSVRTRSGNLALIAAVFDRDTKGTLPPGDDTQTLIGWASRGGVVVQAGVDQSAQDLTMILSASLVTETVDFGTVPTSLPERGALIGIDLGPDGVFQLPLWRTPSEPSLLVPSLSSVSATNYRLTGIAKANTMEIAPTSIVLRRAMTGTVLSAGDWLEPPTNVSVTRLGASWTPNPNATVHSVEYEQDDGTQLLNISVFDSTTSVTIPELLTLPAGLIIGEVNAIGAPGLDPTSFSLDEDRDKLNQVGSSPTQIN